MPTLDFKRALHDPEDVVQEADPQIPHVPRRSLGTRTCCLLLTPLAHDYGTLIH